MKSTQEPKYFIVDENGNELPNARIANRATGKAIPDDEPIMIFRAKDKHARGALVQYYCSCENSEHCAAIDARIGQFEAFKEAHPDRVKEPD